MQPYQNLYSQLMQLRANKNNMLPSIYYKKLKCLRQKIQLSLRHDNQAYFNGNMAINNIKKELGIN